MLKISAQKMQRNENHYMSKKFCTGKKKIQGRKPRDLEGVV